MDVKAHHAATTIANALYEGADLTYSLAQAGKETGALNARQIREVVRCSRAVYFAQKRLKKLAAELRDELVKQQRST